MARRMLMANGVLSIYELSAAQGISPSYAKQILKVLKTAMIDKVEFKGESLYLINLTDEHKQKQIKIDEEGGIE